MCVYVCMLAERCGGMYSECLCACLCVRVHFGVYTSVFSWSGVKLYKACRPTRDELHNGHYGNRLSRWNPSSTPRVPHFLKHRAASVSLNRSVCGVCVCVQALVEAKYLKIDTSSVSGEI